MLCLLYEPDSIKTGTAPERPVVVKGMFKGFECSNFSEFVTELDFVVPISTASMST